MATYYKYAERNVDSFINWAEIGKNITDTLQEENKLREQKKAAIDENSRKLGQQLAEAPTGQSQKMNEWTLKYADQAQKARLLQDKLLKAGRLNPKDYTVQRQNLSDGTNSLFKLSKEYQDEFARKMQRMNDADPNKRSQALESYLMGTVEGFGNFNESEALINPTDYTVNVSMMKQNPKTGMYEPTGDIATVNSLRNRIKGEFNYFNVENANKGIAGKLAEYITAEIKRGSASRAGMVITTEDAMKRPGYQKALDDAIQSFLVNEYNISSILTNDIGVDPKTGKPFSFTFNADEAKKDKSLILLETKNDMPVPKFTEDQKKAAALFMKGQIEQMIRREEKIDTYAEPRPERPTQAELAFARERNNIRNMGNLIGQLYSGTDQEVTAAINYFNGLSTVQKAKRTKDGVSITFTNGITKTIPFKDENKNPVGKTNFVRQGTSLLLGDEADINEAVSGSLRTKSNSLNTLAEAEGQTTTAPKEDPMERFKKFIKTSQELGIKLPGIDYSDKGDGN